MDTQSTSPKSKFIDLEDLIEDEPSIGHEMIRKALSGAPWLHRYLAEWAPLSGEGYVEGHSALARTITVAGVITSTNADDLAFALGLPRWFVCLSIAILETASWRSELLPDLERAAVTTTDNPNDFANLVDGFLMERLDPSVHWTDLLKATGCEILGLGGKICQPLCTKITRPYTCRSRIVSARRRR